MGAEQRRLNRYEQRRKMPDFFNKKHLCMKLPEEVLTCRPPTAAAAGERMYISVSY